MFSKRWQMLCKILIQKRVRIRILNVFKSELKAIIIKIITQNYKEINSP